MVGKLQSCQKEPFLLPSVEYLQATGELLGSLNGFSSGAINHARYARPVAAVGVSVVPRTSGINHTRCITWPPIISILMFEKPASGGDSVDKSRENLVPVLLASTFLLNDDHFY